MIVKEIFYGIKCDRCGEINESGDYSYWSDEETAIDTARDDEWSVETGKHYCPNCYTLNEETDEITVKPPRPDLIKKFRSFILNIIGILPRINEKEDRFEIFINEYKPIGIAEENWLKSFPNVQFERVPQNIYNQIILTIKL